MKFNNKAIYFEDTDTVEQIKSFYKDLGKKEKILQEQEYGNSKFKSNLSLSDIILNINKFNFTGLNQEEVTQIKNLLNKENETLNNACKDFFNLKFIAGLSLIDYLTRKNEELPHEFKYTEESETYIGDFKGVFEDELCEIQSIIDTSPISFYINKPNKKLPFFNFSKSFRENVNIMKNNFISDMELESFNEIVDDYVNFKNSLTKQSKPKM